MSWQRAPSAPSTSDERQANRILHRFPGRVPVIVESFQAFRQSNKTANILRRIIHKEKNVEQQQQQQQQPQQQRRQQQQQHSAEEGAQEVAKAPETVPSQHKFLVPYDCTVGQFQWILRRKIDIEPNKAIFLVVGKSLPHASCLMGELYQNHKKKDGFLYVHYSDENTFG